MENTTPIVGILTSYGKPYLFGLIRNAVEEDKMPYVIVESNDAAVSFAHTFRLMYPSVKPTVLSDLESSVTQDLESPKLEAQVVFTTQRTLLLLLLPYFSPLHAIDFTKHLFYLVPNRIPADVQAYINMKLLEQSYFHGHEIPYVTMYGVNTLNFPVLESKITIFDKHSEAIPVNFQLVGKDTPDVDLCEEMAKIVLRIHMETPGKTIVVILKGRSEIATFQGLLENIETDKTNIVPLRSGTSSELVPRLMFVQNVYSHGEWTISEGRERFTNIYLATDEVLNLVMVPVDVVIDSFRAIVQGRALSGEETTFSTTVSKNVSIGRSTILQNKISSVEAGTCLVMTTKELFDEDPFIPQTIVFYLLMLGKTNLALTDIFPSFVVHNDLVLLQSIGALNPDYRTTALGTFLLDAPLAPLESAVLWLYMQEYWVLGKPCLPAMIAVAMISTFSEEHPYYVYPTFEEDIIHKETTHRRKYWTKFAGEDDLQTFLNIWFGIFADMDTFDPTYDDLRRWGRDNSLNGDRLYMVLHKIHQLQTMVQKYGFVCDEEEVLDPTAGASVLRKVYSQVYLIKRMSSTEEDTTLYKSISDQRVYSIYYPTSINTLSVTNPPEIVCPITSDTDILVAILFR